MKYFISEFIKINLFMMKLCFYCTLWCIYRFGIIVLILSPIILLGILISYSLTGLVKTLILWTILVGLSVIIKKTYSVNKFSIHCDNVYEAIAKGGNFIEKFNPINF